MDDDPVLQDTVQRYNHPTFLARVRVLVLKIVPKVSMYRYIEFSTIYRDIEISSKDRDIEISSKDRIETPIISYRKNRYIEVSYRVFRYIEISHRIFDKSIISYRTIRSYRTLPTCFFAHIPVPSHPRVFLCGFNMHPLKKQLQPLFSDKPLRF